MPTLLRGVDKMSRDLNAKVFKGLGLLVALSKKPTMMPLADACACVNISLSYGEQLAVVLRRMGVIVGVRGPGGGYYFADGAWEIPIMRVIRALAEVPEEGDFSMDARTILAGWERKTVRDYLEFREDREGSGKK